MAKRTLPHAPEAEASVLGGILLRNEALAQLDTLEPEAFYDLRHKAVFAAMRELEAKSRPIDVVTVEAELAKQGKLDAVGGIAYLGDLALRVPTVDNVRAYAELVSKAHRSRLIALTASELAEKGYEPDLDPDEYMRMAMAALAKLDRGGKGDRSSLIGEMARRRIAEIEQLVAARQRGEAAPLVGVPTGIEALDQRLGGYPRGDLVLLMARPGMGKTSMAMACVDAATAAGNPAHVFSVEGGWRMYADRALSRSSGIAVERLRNGDLGGQDMGAIGSAMGRLNARKNWRVDDRPGMTAQEIVRAVRREKPQLGTKLVVVDYVQLVKRARGHEDNENAALDEIVTTFAQAALADDVTYLVLSQMNRKVEDRTDKRPQLADLRGSGALEERPRVIVGPYRGAYYYDEPKEGVDYDCDCVKGAPCRCAPDAETFARTVQVCLLKNNNGQTGRVFARWNPSTTEMY